MNKLMATGIKNALATTIYIIIVASFMNFAQEIKLGYGNKSILMPMVVLLLFVASAGITGFLVFGKPAMLYVDGKKKDSLALVIYTLSSLVAITIGAILLAFSIS